MANQSEFTLWIPAITALAGVALGWVGNMVQTRFAHKQQLEQTQFAHEQELEAAK